MSANKLSDYQKGRKNLIFATIISIPGPLLLAISMTDGTSATQTADLIRRSCEFLTIFLAWVVYELHHIQRKPLDAMALAKQMARLHYKIHSIPLETHPFPTQRDAYLQKIQSRPSLTEADKERLTVLLDELTSPDACRICHGDFHPMNILYQGGKPMVIDWAFSSCGDPRGDVAGTYSITKLLASTSAAHNSFERFLYNTFTPLFAEIYLKEYLALSGYSKEEILRWIPIRAATYLDLGLPDEENDKLRQIAKMT